MAFWNRYPYTDMNQLNLDWILSKIGLVDKARVDAEAAKDAAETAQAGAESAQAAAAASQEAAALSENAAEAAADRTQNLYDDIGGTVAPQVTAWLDENVDPVGSAVVVDDSLSISGAAADAKVTGSEINDLKSDLTSVTEIYSKNLFNENQLLAATAWIENSGVYSGTVGNLYDVYGSNTDGFVIYGGFKENTQYRLATQYYTSTSPVSTGNIIQFRVYYTDNTDSGLIYFDIKTSWTSKYAVTAAGKTVSKITLAWSNQNAATNTIYFKDLHINEGVNAVDYDKYQLTAIDYTSRDILKNELGSVIGYDTNDFEIGNIAITNSGWAYSTDGNKTRVRTKPNVTISLNVDDVIRLTSYDNARYYIGWLNGSGVYSYAGWLTSDFRVYEAGQYVILLCNTVDTVLSSKYDLLNLLRIDKNNKPKSFMGLNWFNNGKMRLHAHKGLIKSDGTIIANSIPAFEYAGKCKSFMCETDARRTSDGAIVCIHDAVLETTTNGSGYVSSTSLADIENLYLLTSGGSVSTERVPTLDQYLKICKKYNMIATIELKEAQYINYVNTVVSLVHTNGMDDSTVFIVSPAQVDIVRSVSNIPILIICTDEYWTDCLALVNKYDYMGITYISSGTLTEDKIITLNTKGAPMDVFEINDVASANNLFNIGMNIITTDILKEADF